MGVVCTYNNLFINHTIHENSKMHVDMVAYCITSARDSHELHQVHVDISRQRQNCIHATSNAVHLLSCHTTETELCI